MRIQDYPNYKIYQINTSKSLAPATPSAPSFGISFKPKALKDLFVRVQSPSDSLSRIKHVRPGQFGTVCDGSKPLADFADAVMDEDFDKICKSGFSTNIGGWAGCFLKSKAYRPLSTSCVFDCSVMYLFNKDKNTHFLYHAYYNTPEEDFKDLIKIFMKEGYTSASLVPGDRYWHDRHELTLDAMFHVLKKSNPDAKINIFHLDSKCPEIVGYKGEMYEIFNRGYAFTNHPSGQASFPISDMRSSNTIKRIQYDGDSLANLNKLRNKFAAAGYDDEILKALSQFIDEKAQKLIAANKFKFNLKYKDWW